MKKNCNRGFSLVEILVVLVIIGSILGILIPKVMTGQNTANVKQTRMKMADLESKVNEYHATCGSYPQSLDFLTQDVSSCKAWTSDPQNKSLKTDAWGTPFQYEATENGFSIESYGKDKKAGGSGPEKDFYSDNSANQ